MRAHDSLIPKAVPVLFRTFVKDVDKTEVVIDGMELSMFATTTSPTIMVTAAMTTVRMRETMSIPPSTFLNIFLLTPPLIRDIVIVNR